MPDPAPSVAESWPAYRYSVSMAVGTFLKARQLQSTKRAATLSKSVCWRLLTRMYGWPEVSIERPRFNHTDPAVAKDQKQVATLLYRIATRSWRSTTKLPGWLWPLASKRCDNKPPFSSGGFHLPLGKCGNPRGHAPLAMTPRGARGTLGKPQFSPLTPLPSLKERNPHARRPLLPAQTQTHKKGPPAHARPRTRGPSHSAPSCPPLGTTTQAPLGRKGHTQTWPAHCLGMPPRQPGQCLADDRYKFSTTTHEEAAV